MFNIINLCLPIQLDHHLLIVKKTAKQITNFFLVKQSQSITLNIIEETQSKI